MPDFKNLSMRTKLVLTIGLLLAMVAVFLMLFFPARMETFSRGWVERRAVGMAIVLANATAPGLEFEDATNLNEILAGLATAPEARWAVVRRSNGTTLAAWKPDLVPTTKPEIRDAPVISYDHDQLRVDAPIHAKGGGAGSLSIGFSVAELAKEKHAHYWVVAGVSIGVFVIGMAVTFLVGTLLGVRPIQQMTDIAQRFVEGDLSGGELRVIGQDEVGRMATVFNRMVEAQRNLVRQVAEASVQLGSAAAQIYAAAQEQEAAAAQQSGSVEEVSTTMQTLLESASHIAESARGVLTNAERSRETTESTASRITELSGHTNRIGELLEIIREIADRSDLLALNASLEATRAGEAGRAFSLVAGEMRRLAERVTASVSDVKTLVADIRTSGTSTVVATEEARKLADSTTESARQITLVTQQQRTGTEQVSQSMREVATVLTQSVATAQQTRSSAEALKTQAERLTAIVAKFRFERAALGG